MCSQVQASCPGSRRSRDRRGQRPGAARRPQPHVDVVEHAVIGLRGERIDQALGEAREIMRAVQRPRAVGIRVRRGRNRRAGSGRDRRRPSSRGRRACPCASDRGLAAPGSGRAGRESGRSTRPMHGPHDAFGDVGEGDAGLLRRDRAGQDPGADQEQAVPGRTGAAGRENPRSESASPSARQARRRVRAGPASRRRSADRSARSMQLRLPRQHVGQPRRGAEDQRHQREQVADSAAAAKTAAPPRCSACRKRSKAASAAAGLSRHAPADRAAAGTNSTRLARAAASPLNAR